MKSRNAARIGAVVTASSLVAVMQSGAVHAQSTSTTTPTSTTTSPLTSTVSVPSSAGGTSQVELPEGDECPLGAARCGERDDGVVEELRDRRGHRLDGPGGQSHRAGGKR